MRPETVQLEQVVRGIAERIVTSAKQFKAKSSSYMRFYGSGAESKEKPHSVSALFFASTCHSGATSISNIRYTYLKLSKHPQAFPLRARLFKTKKYGFDNFCSFIHLDGSHRLTESKRTRTQLKAKESLSQILRDHIRPRHQVT